jgi:hypothetical protein
MRDGGILVILVLLSVSLGLAVDGWIPAWLGGLLIVIGVGVLAALFGEGR